MELTKVCTKCGVEKPATTEYFRHPTGRPINSLRSDCRECGKQSCKSYGILNKEAINTRKTEYNKTNLEKVKLQNKAKYEIHKETRNAYSRSYNRAHKEKLDAYKESYNENHKNWRQEYAQTHKEAIHERTKAYRKANPEISRNRTQRYNACKAKLLATLTTKEWEVIKTRFNNKCCYCGTIASLAQEHFVPVSKGGEYTHNNIISSCGSCNSSKGAKDFYEWYPKQPFYSKTRENKILKFLNISENGNQQLQLFI